MGCYGADENVISIGPREGVLHRRRESHLSRFNLSSLISFLGFLVIVVVVVLLSSLCRNEHLIDAKEELLIAAVKSCPLLLSRPLSGLCCCCSLLSGLPFVAAAAAERGYYPEKARRGCDVNPRRRGRSPTNTLSLLYRS